MDLNFLEILGGTSLKLNSQITKTEWKEVCQTRKILVFKYLYDRKEKNIEEKLVLKAEGMENAELSLDDLEQVAGGTGSARQSGMPCPQCGGFIPVTMRQIIYESCIICPHCGLRIDLNKQESQPAIKALKKYLREQQNNPEQ